MQDDSDNEDENMDKKDEEMDDANDYMDSANEQSFSTLIAQLSDHPLQVIVYESDLNRLQMKIFRLNNWLINFRIIKTMKITRGLRSTITLKQLQI